MLEVRAALKLYAPRFPPVKRMSRMWRKLDIRSWVKVLHDEELLGIPSARMLVALVFLPLLVACGGGGQAGADTPFDTTAGAGGAERGFLMGVSSHPSESTGEAYREAFAVAGAAGEVVLIQRTPPWREFLPGQNISERTERLTLLEKQLAEDNNLKLFLAVDPTVPGDRSQIANLPEDLSDAGFSDKDVRAAFIAYAKYLALNYKPAYMALGVEVDMIFRGRGDGSFRNFISLYFEAYDAVKAVSPETLVFPTFQYEDMLGLLDTGSPTLAPWSLVNRFEPKIDLLAVTSYPGLVFDSVSELPQDYYDALAGRLDRPVAFASVGWQSGATPAADPSSSAQVSYLYRILGAADARNASMLIWYLGRDPQTVPAGFEPLARMGLQDANGNPKTAWRVWTSALARPAPLP